jgi:hypothetical protein
MSDRLAKLRLWGLPAVKLLIALLMAAFIAHSVFKSWAELASRDWTLRPAWLLVCGLLYLAGLLPCGVFWQSVLWAMGQRPRLGNTLAAYFIGHLGKYVPGKALVVVLRTGLIRGPAVDTAVAAVSVIYESLTMMAVGSCLAAVVLLGWHPGQRLFGWLSLAMLFATVLPTLPPVFRRLARWGGLERRSAAAAQQLTPPSFGRLALGWVGIAAGWVCMGLSLWAALRALDARGPAGHPPDPLAGLPVYTAAVALATVAGFVSLIPGGMLVRESVLLALLTPLAGAPNALVVAVLLRLVSIVAELLAAGTMYVMQRQIQNPRSQ